MCLSIGQHKNNKLLIESIAKYFNSPSKVYSNIDFIQIMLSGVQLWESVIFKHFYKYSFHGTKTLRLAKLLLIRELKKKIINI